MMNRLTQFDEGYLMELTGKLVDLDQAMLQFAFLLLDEGYFPDEVIELVERSEVSIVRKFPWCTCGDDHSWHWQYAVAGSPGAFPAIVLML